MVETGSANGEDSPTASAAAIFSLSHTVTENDLHKKLAAAKTKCARDSKRHQRARKRAEELEKALVARSRENEALQAENMQLKSQNRALQSGIGRCGTPPNGQALASFGAASGSRALGSVAAAQDKACDFIPAHGYETVDPDSSLVLVLGANPPLRLSRQHIQAMTIPDFASLLQTYSKAFRRAVSGALNDWTSGSAGGIVGLVNEATALGSLVGMNNSRLRSSYAASIGDSRAATMDYEKLVVALRLTPEQERRLVEMRCTYLCTVALLANERSAILASTQDRECALDTAVGLAAEQVALQQGMEQLTNNLQRQDTYLCTFTEGTLREVLSPMQAAITFIGAAPWYPDVLAMANAVASLTGQPSPAAVIQEAASIRLAPSMEAALRRNGQAAAPVNGKMGHAESGGGAHPLRGAAPRAQRPGHSAGSHPTALQQIAHTYRSASAHPSSLGGFAPSSPPMQSARPAQSEAAAQPTTTAASWTQFSLPTHLEAVWAPPHQTASEAELQSLQGIRSLVATSTSRGAPDQPQAVAMHQSFPDAVFEASGGAGDTGGATSRHHSGGLQDSASVNLASTPAFGSPAPKGSPGVVVEGPRTVHPPGPPNNGANQPREFGNGATGAQHVPVRCSIADMPLSFSSGSQQHVAYPPFAGGPLHFGTQAAQPSNGFRMENSHPPGGVGQHDTARQASDGALLGTLSELMDAAPVGAPRPSGHPRTSLGYPPAHQGMSLGFLANHAAYQGPDLARTWSPILRAGSGRLPSAISFGLPLLSGNGKFPSAMSLGPIDMQTLSPSISLMLPDMATILAGINGDMPEEGGDAMGWVQGWPPRLEASRH